MLCKNGMVVGGNGMVVDENIIKDQSYHLVQTVSVPASSSQFLKYNDTQSSRNVIKTKVSCPKFVIINYVSLSGMIIMSLARCGLLC